MQTILRFNEFLNRRVPVLKTIARAVIPHGIRARFAARKFSLTIEDSSYSKTFANIHQKNWWGSRESISGCGSQLNRTVTIRRELRQWIGANNIRSIFDAPCGDYNWMNEVIKSSNVRYLGGDIVEEIIHTNSSKFATTDQISFAMFDILQDTLPDADAWVCRDVLFHFPNDAIATVLKRFEKSEIRFLLTSHFKDTNEHPDIKFGGYRPVNLCRPPFNWPAPYMVIFDGDNGAEADRYLGIWQNPSAGPP
jgi:hypothetical protein